jgi:Trk K+ transport system NAD-binding subunit
LIEESDALVASTNSDALNTVIAMLAKRFDVPDGVLVLTVVRGEEVLLARGKTRVQSGDSLLLLVENEHAFGRMNELVNRGEHTRVSPARHSGC